MLNTFVPGNFVRADAVEELTLLAQSEAVRVDPCAVDTLKCPVKILLAVLFALDEGDVGERGKFFGAGVANVTGEDPDAVSLGFGESCSTMLE